VTEVAVHSDRLEFLSNGGWLSIQLFDIAEWPRPRWLWRSLGLLGLRPRSLMVGEREFCRPASERYFRFFTRPPLTIYMPDEPEGTSYGNMLFRRIQDELSLGGFHTFDLA
jgi:hypothetical protein